MAIGSNQPFRPSGTTQLNVNNTSANIALIGSGDSVLIHNASAALAFVRFGTDSTMVASVADTPIPANARMLMHIGSLVTTVAAVLSSGSGAVFFTRGDGTVY